MFDRHWLGDLALAVLLVLPFTSLVTAPPATHAQGRLSVDRISLLR